MAVVRPRAALGAAFVLSLMGPAVAPAQIDPGVAVTTSDNSRGDVDFIDIDPPWATSQDLEPVGIRPRIRYFFDRIYVVNRAEDEIQVVDPQTFDTLVTLLPGAGTTPEDIFVLRPDRAYVTLHTGTDLKIMNPATGAMLGSVDLSGFADADGFPEPSMMARDGSRLFIQIQRVDNLSNNPIRPSYLAVLDLETDTLIDIDPDTAGIQGIVLTGTIPSYRMHVDARARRLFVSTPGPRLETSGGIEEIDLNTLEGLGYILSEKSVSADVGGFVMTSPDAGFALSHTDIVASSHLFPFSRSGGQGAEIMLTFGFIEILAFDPATSQLFFPDPFSMPFGVHVIDPQTNTVVTSSPIATGLPPWDATIVRATTPGEVRDLTVEGIDPSTGEMSLGYWPACGASTHNIVFGPLAAVGTSGYSGEICDVGSTGSVASFDPGPGAFFFLLVGTDAAGRAGSYGAGSDGVERPPFLGASSCATVQDLSFSCDR